MRIALAQRRDGLGAHREPLARGPEPVERGGRALAAAGRVGELHLERLALAAQGLEALLGARSRCALERRESFLGRARPLRGGTAGGRGRPGGCGGLGRRPLERARRLVGDLARGGLGLAELAAQPLPAATARLPA